MTNQKTVPLYSGLPEDPNRKLIGECTVDLDTGKAISTITKASESPPFPIGTTIGFTMCDHREFLSGYVLPSSSKIGTDA